MNQSRLNRVIEGMKRENLPCILVSDIESVFYLTGRWIEPGERMIALEIRDDGRVCLFANRLFAPIKNLFHGKHKESVGGGDAK